MNQLPWTHLAADYLGQVPWIYSGQGIYIEATAEKCDEQSLQGFLDL